jgi:dTDP-L-rhamnose 4-epimerase
VVAERVLITGGAGFIGAHVASELLRQGYEVRAFDALHPQVHTDGGWPGYLHAGVERVVGDVRDRAAMREALDGVDRVVHLAARVGVGQSMYEIHDYVSVNATGTAVLLEALVDRPVRSLVVASSMSVYGEGSYEDVDGRPARAQVRTPGQLRGAGWDPLDGQGRPLVPVPTAETKPPSLSSVYALTKYDQERLCLLVGEAYGIPTVALRFFNVYGPYQALSNPYTGVLAIFAARLLNGRPPMVFEDGLQRRDFVSVHDVARACALALTADAAAGSAVNVASGCSRTVEEIAVRLAAVLGVEHLAPEITGKVRVGDIRHCFADISRARVLLGYEPQVDFDDGIAELAAWLEGQVAVDRVDDATQELAARGLTA